MTLTRHLLLESARSPGFEQQRSDCLFEGSVWSKETSATLFCVAGESVGAPVPRPPAFPILAVKKRPALGHSSSGTSPKFLKYSPVPRRVLFHFPFPFKPTTSSPSYLAYSSVRRTSFSVSCFFFAKVSLEQQATLFFLPDLGSPDRCVPALPSLRQTIPRPWCQS